MVVEGCFQVGLCFGKGLRNNGSKGRVEIGEYFWNCSLDESGILIDEAG